MASSASESRGGGPLGPPTVQRLRATALPAGMPDAHGLGGDAELAGDLGLLADASGEQLGGARPASLEPVAFLLCRGAARDGWHGADPHPPAAQLQPHRLLNPTPKTR